MSKQIATAPAAKPALEQLHIRRALPADAQSLCEAERDTARTPGLLVSHPAEFNVAAFENTITALNLDGLYLVAERDGKTVGHALLQPLGLQAMAHVLSLTIVVHPGHLEQGIGRALMSALLAWACTRPGLLKIELRVRETNYRARRLYQRFGFVEEGHLHKRICLPDGTLIGDVLMAWFVPDIDQTSALR